MKKQALRAITMLFSIIVLAYVTAIASNAQSLGLRLKAHIPFDFVVGDKTLAAGEYMVDQLTTTSNAGISLRSRDGNYKAVRLTTPVEANAKMQKTTLTFRRYGDTYYLAQVWLAGSSEGRELLKSKAERAADRELAQNSKPEIVTIAAIE
jgi:hypothetical protein